MSKKKIDNSIKKNYFPLRISNDNTLLFIDELMGMKLFSSRNELLNKCIDNGILEYAKKYLRHRKVDAPKENKVMNAEATTMEMRRSLKQIENTTDDVFVMIGLLEHLVTTIYNVMAEQLDGEVVVKDDMTSGRLSDLPEYLQDIKDEITKRYYTK